MIVDFHIDRSDVDVCHLVEQQSTIPSMVVVNQFLVTPTPKHINSIIFVIDGWGGRENTNQISWDEWKWRLDGGAGWMNLHAKSIASLQIIGYYDVGFVFFCCCCCVRLFHWTPLNHSRFNSTSQFCSLVNRTLFVWKLVLYNFYCFFDLDFWLLFMIIPYINWYFEIILALLATTTSKSNLWIISCCLLSIVQQLNKTAFTSTRKIVR